MFIFDPSGMKPNTIPIFYFIIIFILQLNIYIALTVAAGFPPAETHSMAISLCWRAKIKSAGSIVGAPPGTITESCMKRDRMPG